MADPDYGRALSCVSDISPESRMVTGNRVVAEALARRLFTPRGRLIGYPNYGYDLTQHANADVSPNDLLTINAETRAECNKDPRVNDTVVTTTLEGDGTLRVHIAADGAQGPFELVLSVSAVTVSLLKVSPS